MWMNALYQGVDVNSRRSVKEHFMIQYSGKVETTTIGHQISKLIQDKAETAVILPNDALRKCKNL